MDSSNETENEDDNEDMDTCRDKRRSFVNSIPENRKFKCCECDKLLQCTDCFVRHFRKDELWT